MPRPESETREAQKRELEKRMARNWNQVFDVIEGKSNGR
jgi:hypothetical protein